MRYKAEYYHRQKKAQQSRQYSMPPTAALYVLLKCKGRSPINVEAPAPPVTAGTNCFQRLPVFDIPISGIGTEFNITCFIVIIEFALIIDTHNCGVREYLHHQPTGTLDPMRFRYRDMLRMVHRYPVQLRPNSCRSCYSVRLPYAVNRLERHYLWIAARHVTISEHRLTVPVTVLRDEKILHQLPLPVIVKLESVVLC